MEKERGEAMTFLHISCSISRTGNWNIEERFPRLAAGQVWIANCPTTMIESAPGEFRGSIYRRSRMHPLLVPRISISWPDLGNGLAPRVGNEYKGLLLVGFIFVENFLSFLS